MATGLVTCRKCKRTFDYDKYNGICPKCARYYSLTNYHEEESLLKNILDPANEENCSYHGGHVNTLGNTGHSERMHSMDGNARRNVNRKSNTLGNKVFITIIFIALLRAFISWLIS